MIIKDMIIKPESTGIFKLNSLIGSEKHELNQIGLDALSQFLKEGISDKPTPEQTFFLEKFGKYLSNGDGDLPIHKGGLESISIELLQKCNLKCSHCYLGEKQDERIELGVFKQLIDSASRFGAYSLGLTGGEPFLDAEIFDKIAYARNKGMGVSVNTNGTLLTSEKISKLKALKVQNIAVTLCGDKTEHEYIYGAGTYDRIIEVLEELSKHEISSSVTHIVYPMNYDNVENFLKSMERFRLNNINISPISNKGNARLNPDLILSDDKVKKLENKYNPKRVDIKDMPTKGLSCGANGKTFFIKSNGDLQPCPEFEGFIFGNIKHDSLEFILGNPNENLLLARNFDHTKIKGCSTCKEYDVCGGGCRGRAYNQGDIYGPDKLTCIYNKK